MKKNKVSISTDLSICKFSILVFKYFRVFIVFYVLLSITILVASEGKLYDLVGTYFIILFGGLIMSALVHEYVHIYFFARFGVERTVIDTEIFRFRIIPEKQLQARELRIVALAGPLSCVIIGLVLCGVECIGYKNVTISIVKTIYFIHLINVIPFFGDGKCIVKSMI